jgi:cation transport ATPase
MDIPRREGAARQTLSPGDRAARHPGLRTSGVSRIVMLTGDRAETAEAIGAALDIDFVLSDRDPTNKIAAVAVEQELQPTLMVGDGVNDAPALAAANVGVAMGARGASASSEAADVVILVDAVDRVSYAVGIARRTYVIAFQSMAGGMALSCLVMIAAAFGWLTPIAGALTQEASDVVVILNALRGAGLRAQLEARRPAGERRESVTRGAYEARSEPRSAAMSLALSTRPNRVRAWN